MEHSNLDWIHANEALAWDAGYLGQRVEIVQLVGYREKLEGQQHHDKQDAELLRRELSTYHLCQSRRRT